MESFCHINELGAQGWDSLRTLVLASARVSIWAPSALYLEHCRTRYPLLPKPDELLWYIRNGNVQILARKEWLTKPDARNSYPWPFAKWVDSFDEEILRIWQDDQASGRTSTTAHVRTMPKERGRTWARRQIRLNRVDPRTLMKVAEATLGALTGYREKIEGLSKPKAAESLLRDAYNHGEAFRQSGADRNLGLPSDTKLLSVFAKSAQVGEVNRTLIEQNAPSAREISDALNSVLDRLQAADKSAMHSEEAFQRVQMILSSPNELENLRQWVRLGDQLAAGRSTVDYERELADLLARQLQAGASRSTLLAYLKPSTKIDWITSMVSLFLAVLGFTTGNPTAPLSLTVFSANRLLGAMQWVGWIPDSHAGAKWPFYIAEGSTSVFRTRREALIKALRRGTKR